VFDRNGVGGLDCCCEARDKGEWRVLLCIVICNRVYRQLC
jgi:hypothetical protein